MAGFLTTPFVITIARAGAQITLRSTVGGMIAVAGAAFVLYAAYRHFVEPRLGPAPRRLKLRSGVPSRPEA